MRTENDIIGEKLIPKDAFYGIHSIRARENFPYKSDFSIDWYKAIGVTKLAVFNTCKNFKQAANNKYPGKKTLFNFISDDVLRKLTESASEIADGVYFDSFIVPAIQGGAGTSINMNVNEILANASLQKLNEKPGNYSIIDPVEHANIFQSTNDVIPTSLKVVVLKLLTKLETTINNLRSKTEFLEKEHRNSLRIAYTQMQEAVPSSYGKLFSCYNDALSRDWWRVSKCFERIKSVNLGGTAIGTGITAPRFYIMEVVQELQNLTGLPVTRAENLEDNTSNHDSLVEIHATLKAHAVNLEKMVNDIRLLSSDLIGNKEIQIPRKQTGSSIMPSKVNPVITEYVISVAHTVYSNDQLISGLAAQGVLDLNAYLPVIGNALIESINLLIAANETLCKNLFEGLTINKEIALEKLFHSPAITTALIPYIGYNKSAQLSDEMNKRSIDIFQSNSKLKLIEQNKLKQILSLDNLLRTGFTIDDLIS
ncbi:MAG: lyase family protein [Bacteroidota bacterium]